MNALPKNNMEAAEGRRPARLTPAWVIIPALVSFLAGAALSAVWFSRSLPAARNASGAGNPAAVALSDSTTVVPPRLDAPVDTAALDAVRRSIPNLDAISLEQGEKMLRDASMVQFKQATEETEARMKEAEQRFIQAQGNQSEAVRQAAAEQLRIIQAEGTRKLQQIAQDSHAQIAALQQLKQPTP
jgi:hypothetical protein